MHKKSLAQDNNRQRHEHKNSLNEFILTYADFFPHPPLVIDILYHLSTNYRRWSMIMPMKTRDQTLTRVKNSNQCRSQHDSKLRALRTDNAQEYCRDVFKTFLIENGMLNETSTLTDNIRMGLRSDTTYPFKKWRKR